MWIPEGENNIIEKSEKINILLYREQDFEMWSHWVADAINQWLHYAAIIAPWEKEYFSNIILENHKNVQL